MSPEEKIHGISHPRSQGLIDAAYRFARKAHGSQVRKYTGENYVDSHCCEVARLVASVTSDCTIIAAAFLHDVLEDTPVTYDVLAAQEAGFGHDIAMLVVGMTDVSQPGDGNRAFRKALDRQHMAMQNAKVHTIKLADLISNTRSIVEHDPDFARVYLKEKELLLEILEDGHAELLEHARTLLVQGQMQLEKDDEYELEKC